MDYEQMLALLEAGGATFVLHRHQPLRSVAEASAIGLPIDKAAKTLAVMAGGDVTVQVGAPGTPGQVPRYRCQG